MIKDWFRCFILPGSTAISGFLGWNGVHHNFGEKWPWIWWVLLFSSVMGLIEIVRMFKRG